MNDINPPEKNLDDLAGGLFLMIIFTITWVVIAETNLTGRDHWMPAVVFSFVIAYFLSHYIRISKASKNELKDAAINEAEKKKVKRFLII